MCLDISIELISYCAGDGYGQADVLWPLPRNRFGEKKFADRLRLLPDFFGANGS
jgi:hypothetical protein